MLKEERKRVLWLKKKGKGQCGKRRKEKGTVFKEEKKSLLLLRKKGKGAVVKKKEKGESEKVGKAVWRRDGLNCCETMRKYKTLYFSGTM